MKKRHCVPEMRTRTKKKYSDFSVEHIRIEIVSFTDSNYMLI